MITNDYVVIDIESTGLNPKTDKIIEIGAARVRNGVVEENYVSYFNPGRSLSEKVIEITGIKDEDLEKAPYIETEIEKIVNFIGYDVLVGHNLIFDYSFIKKAAVNNKISFNKNGIDTLKIARRFIQGSESNRLGDLCAYYNIELEAHRALNDALATHELYQHLIADFSEKEDTLFMPKELVYAVKKEGPITPRQKDFISGLCKQYNIPLENNIIYLNKKANPLKGFADIIDMERLTKNEASRFIDCLRSSFGSM